MKPSRFITKTYADADALAAGLNAVTSERHYEQAEPNLAALGIPILTCVYVPRFVTDVPQYGFTVVYERQLI